MTILFCFVLTLHTVQALASDMVVVSSTSSEISSGQIIRDGTTLELSAGTSVSLISPAGQMHHLEGPFSGIPGQGIVTSEDTSIVASLSNLFSNADDKSSDLGAMRAFQSDNMYEPLSVNVTLAGKQCIPANEHPLLWRPKTSKSTMLFVESMGGSGAAEMEWSSDDRTLKWPPEIALQDGQTYSFYLKTLDVRREITLVFTPDTFASLPHKAIWMADHGCVRQAKLLLTMEN